MSPTPTEPTATYRLQLGPDFGFDDAAAVVDRLHDLGISHLYLSPILEAAPGSTHGYDTVDHGLISIVMGGRDGFDRLSKAVARAGMGLVVDIVPNHMSIAVPRANHWWWDVLANGPESRFADHFDVSWESTESRQNDTVLLPILGDHYGVVLEAGEITLERSGGDGLVVRYFDHLLPLSPESVSQILTAATDEAETETTAESGSMRLDAHLARINSDPDALHEVLEQQHYQLSHWRRAQRDLDYRRFFDIDTLIGVRMEDPAVFAASHGLVIDLVASGQVSGLRVDHPDGLTDPAEYFTRLRQACGSAWIVVEKILEAGEHLPSTWEVDGTTGYDFLRMVEGVFRSPDDVAATTDWWQAHVDAATWEETVAEAKGEILRTVLAADVVRLADLGLRLCEQNRRHRDHTRHDVNAALRSIVAAMPVYRTYVRHGETPATEDLTIISEACAAARADDGDVGDDLYDFLESILRGDHGDPLSREFVQRFQQLTGPAMAKSVEDTAFYRYLPLVSANEVGGDPGEPVVSIDAFHAHNADIQQQWPGTMTTLSTHDTKRSADVRARLDACLSDPDRWLAFLRRWSAWCDGAWAVDPDRAATALLLQTVVGAWPIDRDRLVAYMEKATKEAKRRTSWTEPDEDYDAAVVRLVEVLVDHDDFIREVGELVSDRGALGRHIACARQLLQLTSPGVPDCYQGSELWDRSLVDPDNRRPVDHGVRAEVMARLVSNGGPTVSAADDDIGAHKLWITHQALRLRRERPATFGPGHSGAYRPIDVGRDAIAFARGADVIVGVAIGTTAFTLPLPEGRWIDRLTGGDHHGPTRVESMALFARVDP